MPRLSRIVFPGVPHHLSQRGIRQASIFLDDFDRRFYSQLLMDASKRHCMDIHSYTWMTNHIHIIAVPGYADTFAKTFQQAHSEYAREFNKKYGLRGYLWQERFFSCPMDEEHYWAAIRYVERNPVRAGMVKRAEDYQWSSARAHCGLAEDKLITPDLVPPLGVTNWSEWLAEPNPKDCDKKIRKCTFGGWPCGDKHFVENLEKLSGRVLSPQRPGPKCEDR